MFSVLKTRFAVSCMMMLSLLAVMPSTSFNFVPQKSFRRPALTVVELAVQQREEEESRNAVYKMLSTPRDQKPGRRNFFYNDEVISHLHGYMYLVGFFAAHDETFLFSFLLFAAAAAGATMAGQLPANPRVPALVALASLTVTLVCRYLLGLEPMLLPAVYSGPADSALYYEVVICALNMVWGFWGTWRTKEQVDGATFGI